MEGHLGVLLLMVFCALLADTLTINHLRMSEESSDEVRELVSSSRDENSEALVNGTNLEKISRHYKRLNTQMKQLNKMKCRPRRVKVPVESVLDNRPEFQAKYLFPKVLPVRRCLADCSFCGDDEQAMERKICISVDKKDKLFTVYYIKENGKREYAKLSLEVDLRCECMQE